MSREIAIVGTVNSGMVPNTLDGVELWRIGRKIEDFHILAMIGEPAPHGFVLVVRRIVLDQIDFAQTITA